MSHLDPFGHKWDLLDSNIKRLECLLRYPLRCPLDNPLGNPLGNPFRCQLVVLSRIQLGIHYYLLRYPHRYSFWIHEYLLGHPLQCPLRYPLENPHRYPLIIQWNALRQLLRYPLGYPLKNLLAMHSTQESTRVFMWLFKCWTSSVYVMLTSVKQLT